MWAALGDAKVAQATGAGQAHQAIREGAAEEIYNTYSMVDAIRANTVADWEWVGWADMPQAAQVHNIGLVEDFQLGLWVGPSY